MILDYFAQYLNNERKYSSHTVTAYCKDIDQFFLFLDLNPKNIECVNLDNARSWVIALKKKGLSSRSINRKISALKFFFSFCEREKYIQLNPVLRLKNLKDSKRLPVVVSESSLRNLFDYDGVFEENFRGMRDRLILELFYQTGIRLAELINIKLTDYNRASNELVILGKRNKQRVVPLTDSLVLLLNQYLHARLQKHPSSGLNFMFLSDKGKKSYPKMIYRIVNYYLSMVSSVQKKSPHILRHAFATHLLNRGADLNAIKDLLGHSTLLSTQVYTQVSGEKIKKTYKKSHPRGS